MFTLSECHSPAKGIQVFRNENKVMEILQHGATLNYLKLMDLDLILGYSELTPASLKASRSAILFPFPNRLRDGKYVIDDKEFQFPINEPENHNALHGFVKDRYFDQVLHESKSSSAIVEMKMNYEGDLSYYPFSFEFVAQYEITERELKVQHSIVNRGNTSMPYGYGWHPYFHFDQSIDSLMLKLPDCEQLMLDDRQLPTGQLKKYHAFQRFETLGAKKLDAGFKAQASHQEVSVRLVDQRLLTMKLNEMEYFQVFTPDERDCIAIEPMSSGIDVFNTKEGLSVVNPGSTVTHTTQLFIQS